MRPLRQRPVVAVTAALIVLAAVAGPAQAGPASWLTASPTSSKIQLAPGGSVEVRVTNTDRRASSSALTVTLGLNPATAPFSIVRDQCSGVVLRPGDSCKVEVGYSGSKPTSDHAAALTVSSGKPMKASVTRIIEVGVSFADVCASRGGVAGFGGTLTLINVTFAVAERCDWTTPLVNTVYNAAFDALSPECFDLTDNGTVGYPVTGETGLPAIGCVAG